MRPTHRSSRYPTTRKVRPGPTADDTVPTTTTLPTTALPTTAPTPGRPDEEGHGPPSGSARRRVDTRPSLLPIPLPPRVTSIAALAITAGALTATTGVAQSAVPSPTWPRGIDVASWQHPGGSPIDWIAARGSGLSFAIIKATEGTNYTNPYFAADREAAAKAGLVVGAYHYARPARPISTAVDQAQRFITVSGLTRAAGQLAPVLDLEDDGGLDPATLAAWTRAFLEKIETETGRAPILYTYRSFWTKKLADDHSFARYPFWFAIYNNKATPGWLPGGWTKWALWQYTSSGNVPGIMGNVDLNVLCCTPTALAAQADGTHSEIEKWYATAGLNRLAVGTPVDSELPAGGGGRWQRYSNGLAFWSVATSVRALHGSIATKFLELGGTNSFLHRPVSGVEYATASETLQARFQGGWIYWHPAIGAHEVHGRILQTYLGLGGTTSSLGPPITDEYSVPGGRESAFQFGKLRWSAATNAVTTLPAGKSGTGRSGVGAAGGAGIAP
ncbi:GH25 family lysozyme [Frankia sp. CcWB2]